MERMTRRVRQTRMMDPRPPCGLLGTFGVLGSGLLFAALAGCGSVVASSGAAAAPAAATPVPQVGCASVNQATAVSIRREMRLMAPVGTNPISIIVPCHRVIGSDGSLTGYGGGLDRKELLLRLEGAGPVTLW